MHTSRLCRFDLINKRGLGPTTINLLLKLRRSERHRLGQSLSSPEGEGIHRHLDRHGILSIPINHENGAGVKVNVIRKAVTNHLKLIIDVDPIVHCSPPVGADASVVDDLIPPVAIHVFRVKKVDNVTG